MKREVNQLKAGSLLSYVNVLISTIIPLLYTPIMLSLLGQSEYGLYSLSNSVISYLSLLTLGLGSTVIRYMVKYRTDGDKEMFERVTGLFVSIYVIIAIVTCIVGCSITFFSGSLFQQGLTSEEISKLNILIIIMSVSTAVSFVSSAYSSVIICYEKYIFRKLVDMITTIGAPIVNLILLYAGFASVGMAAATLGTQILVMIINIIYCRKALHIHEKFRNPPKELLRGIFSFTLFVFIGLIADLLYWATDKVLIGALLGSVAVAIYNVGSTFNIMLQNLSGAISGVFAPRVNMLVFKKNPISDISELMIRVGRLQYLIVSLVVSGFIVFGQSFIIMWAGADYKDAYPVALLTMIPLVIPLIQNVAFTAICAQNRHQFRSVLYFILAILNAVSTYLLIPIMGIVGAALCTCVVFVIGQGIIMNWFYYKKIGLDILGFWLNILKMTVVPVVMVIICKIINLFGISANSLWSLLVLIIIFTLLFCILTWFFTMNRYEKDLFIGLVKKVIPKRG